MRIYLDTETTGLIAAEDDVLQLAIIDDDGNALFNRYFRPSKKTEWPGAEQVNHISPDMVKDCPSIAEWLPEIQSIIDAADEIAIYNAVFDLGMLEASGVTVPDEKRIIDVMIDFARVYGEWSEYFGDYKWQKLVKAAYFYGYDWGDSNAHDALADCYATRHVQHRMEE